MTFLLCILFASEEMGASAPNSPRWRAASLYPPEAVTQIFKRFGYIFLLFPLLLIATGCSTSAPPIAGMKVGKPYAIGGKTYYPAHEPSYDKVGDASWYGPGFHGKYTASGEVFNQNDMTAAHPTLPMPSLVRVTNLANGKSVMVRINDRGPFKSNRIIDLSKQAATALNLLSVGKVRVQYLPEETNDYIAQAMDTGKNNISVASFNNRKAVESSEQIVEENVQNTALGQTVNEAAPIQSVSSETLNGSVKAQDLPDLTQNTLDEEASAKNTKVTKLVYNPPPVEKRMVRDETGKPVQFKGAGDQDENGIDIAAAPAPRRSPFRPVRDAEAAETPKPKAQLAPSGGGSVHIQVGSFASEDNARKLDSKLSGIGAVNIAKTEAAGKEWWRVRVGPFNSRTEAAAALEQVHQAGLPDARIIQ